MDKRVKTFTVNLHNFVDALKHDVFIRKAFPADAAVVGVEREEYDVLRRTGGPNRIVVFVTSSEYPVVPEGGRIPEGPPILATVLN